MRSVQVDPIGAVSRQKVLAPATELYIHPRITHVDAAAVGVLRDVEGVTTSNLSSSDVSFHALREYVPGDDRRSIHWRTTARTGKLMVRQFEETMRAHLLVMLSTVAADYETEDDFELAVSVAGSLAPRRRCATTVRSACTPRWASSVSPTCWACSTGSPA